MASDNTVPDEMVSLSKQLLGVDFDCLSAEELERRLELSIIVFPTAPQDCCGNGCKSLLCCTKSL